MNSVPAIKTINNLYNVIAEYCFNSQTTSHSDFMLPLRIQTFKDFVLGLLFANTASIKIIDKHM